MDFAGPHERQKGSPTAVGPAYNNGPASLGTLPTAVAGNTAWGNSA
jgi:hypothetical protein